MYNVVLMRSTDRMVDYYVTGDFDGNKRVRLKVTTNGRTWRPVPFYTDNLFSIFYMREDIIEFLEGREVGRAEIDCCEHYLPM